MRCVRDTQEQVAAPVRLVADRKLVRKVPDGHIGRLAEHQPRILVVPDVVARALLEVTPLLALKTEPVDGPVREHGVQDHQALYCPVDRDPSAVPVIRLADGRVQRPVVHVDDSGPSRRAELDRGREPPEEQCPDEVVDLLSVRDAGERRVLPTDEYAGVPHDGDEETCLTIREAERRERSIAFTRSIIRDRRM
jgi:hypothetical protein